MKEADQMVFKTNFYLSSQCSVSFPFAPLLGSSHIDRGKLLRNVEKWNKQNAYEKFLGISIKRKQQQTHKHTHTEKSTNKLWGIWGGRLEDCVAGERKTVKNRNRNHIFFISTIVGWSLLWFEALTAPETDSTCFRFEWQGNFHTRTSAHTHIQLAGIWILWEIGFTQFRKCLAVSKNINTFAQRQSKTASLPGDQQS